MNDGTDLTEFSQAPTLNIAAMPVALAVYLDDKLYERVSTIALRMSKADGVTPKHLLSKPEACFAVVTRAITWRLDPFAVAMATYQTPGGQIGFYGSLINAIIENSGRLAQGSGGVHFALYGDWSKVQGNFAMRESSKKDDDGRAKKYAAATWTDEDARAGGCGVEVSAQLRGEQTQRTMRFDLIQAQPRNSTLWATDPKTQICYTACRRFASLVVPGLMMGVPFDPEDSPREIDMGDAVQVERNIQMPRAQEQQQTSSMPEDSEDVPTPPRDETASSSSSGSRIETSPSTASGSAPLITPSALVILTRKLEDLYGGKFPTAFCTQFQIENPEALPMAQVNAAFAWIATQTK